jgi:hypothetical protein
VGSRRVDEALDESPVGALDVGIVGGRVGQGAQHGAVLGEHGDDALRRGVHELATAAAVGVPALGQREELAADVLDHPQHEMVPVAEVDVERRARELRPPHHLVTVRSRNGRSRSSASAAAMISCSATCGGRRRRRPGSVVSGAPVAARGA